MTFGNLIYLFFVVCFFRRRSDCGNSVPTTEHTHISHTFVQHIHLNFACECRFLLLCRRRESREDGNGGWRGWLCHESRIKWLAKRKEYEWISTGECRVERWAIHKSGLWIECEWHGNGEMWHRTKPHFPHFDFVNIFRGLASGTKRFTKSGVNDWFISNYISFSASTTGNGWRTTRQHYSWFIQKYIAL